MARILIAEDDVELSHTVVEWLKHEKYLVEAVRNGLEALERLRASEYDAVVLDWMMPELSGLEVLRQYRHCGGKAPILMLTAKAAVQEKETGLDAGADDYLTKPFNVRELGARLRALLRRPPTISPATLQVGPLELDRASHRITRDARELMLAPKEYDLLEFLMRHPNQVFSAEVLVDRVWGLDADISPESIRTYIKRLRQQLDQAGSPSLIRTFQGVGYKLDVP